MRIIIILTALVAILTACETATTVENEPSTTWQYYYAEFNRLDNAVEAGATFRKGSSTGEVLSLVGGSTVTVNGQSMGYSNATNASYFRRVSGIVDAGFGLRFDQGGNITTFANTVKVTDIDTIGYPSADFLIDSTAELEVAWQGAPVGPNEVIAVEFKTVTRGTVTVKQDEISATSVLVQEDVVRSISEPGTKWRLIRTRTGLPLQQPTAAGGTMSVAWTTGFNPVTFL